MSVTTESKGVGLRPPRSNPILTREDWEKQRQAFLADPGGFFGEIARELMHWYDPDLNAWIMWNATSESWEGVHADTGDAVDVPYKKDHMPWKRGFNGDTPPFYKWFEGGLTNACFNEVDRHVLTGYGDEIAFHYEGDRWDSSLNKGRGGPVVSHSITRKKLLLEVVKAAQVLKDLGLKRGDRIALNMPNILEQIYYTEAAKRLGIIYTAVFGGFSDKTLSDRLHNAGAKVIITCDGGYRNAQVVDFKEIYTDPALDKFVPIEMAQQIVDDTLLKMKGTLSDEQRELLSQRVTEAIAGEITVERSDVMRGVGRALDEMQMLDAATQSHIRTSLAQALVESPARVDTVIVVRHTGHEILWRSERDQWSHELIESARGTIMANAQSAGFKVNSEEELLNLPDNDFVRALYASSKCEVVDAEYPLFIIYTSGSTGKPKGVVHVHGGYTAGLIYTMFVSFDAEPGDTIFVVADPGWITGQSYMITASLASRCIGVLAEGSPVFPSAGRFASMIERYNVDIFKAGVTFLKGVMTDPQNKADVLQYDMSSLRVCTFCAEPVSPAVQQFGMEIMSPQYINSYWATEHGGIVWTHFYGNDDYPLRADAHTYPLPWVLGDVWVSETTPEESGNGHEPKVREADYEEKGEIVIKHPYPYLARTIWGDEQNFKIEGHSVASGWRGDAERFIKTYWKRGPDNEWAYVQGDFAMKYTDDSFSLHGRSDDVINVSGHRMGTEEIEGAILRDKQIVGDSPVGNVVVVGAPHREKGLTPVAFIQTIGERKLSSEDRRRLNELVRNEKGVVSVPEDYIEVTAFPETRSGKYMRRYLRNMMLDEPLGDTTTLRNPEVLEELGTKINTWKHRQRLSEEQQIFERYRYFEIQYQPVTDTSKMALVTVNNPPVNALNERSLDELNTLLDHLARREDIMAIIFTGAGTKSFVAGADIRQLLEEIHTLEDALAIPNNAHLAFRKIEKMNKPCIAAINGVALGGGMEFAMACHYRIADMHAEFGQPEVNLRLLPGYGGSQRMPRLLFDRRGEEGLAKALMVIMGGRTVNAERAYEVGLIDMVAHASEDVVTLATRMVREYADAKEQAEAHPVPGSELHDDVEDHADEPKTFFSRFHFAESPVDVWPRLPEAFRHRRELTKQWEKPQPEFVKEHLEPLLKRPIITRLLKQAEWAGRTKTLGRIIDAIRFGYENGLEKGLEHEAHLFAEAVVAKDEGKHGIQAFMDRVHAPLPTRRRITLTEEEEQHLIEQGYLVPLGAPFFPGITPIPVAQYAMAAIRDEETGAARHGDPIEVEQQIIIPVEKPGPMDVQLYMLASEVNFNDIWAITGVPVSLFDDHDRDWHVTGSGGIGLIVSMGEAVRREGRLKVGDLVTIYSGQSDLLSPMQGLDPMAADFVIQGYQTPDASHQQFMLAQAPQCLPLPPDLTLEAAGSYILNLGTVYRGLFTTLKVQPGHRIFIEGAATGTGMDAVKSAARNNLHVTGMVSSPARAQTIKQAGAVGFINRKDERYKGIFTRVPEDPSEWSTWESAGDPMLDDFRAQNGGHLADYALSHAGEISFPRSFQLLGEPHGNFIPTLAFYGASSGYHFTFLGKSGAVPAEDMLTRASLRAGEAVLIYYGLERYHQHGQRSTTQLMDGAGLEAIEAARVKGARIVVVTYTDAQREFIQSLGFGAALRGVVSLEELKRRFGNDFEWPRTMPSLPDAKKDLDRFKASVRNYNDLTFKPLGSAVGTYLRSADNPRGYPDLVIERAGHDALGVSATMIKPFVGRIIYFEDMGSQRYSFFAPQIWMRQRRIYMPSANIFGTHLSNAYEVVKLNDEISAGLLTVTDPILVPWEELPEAHQAMWENRHAGATYVVNHALPRSGLKSKDELYEAWAESWLQGDNGA